MGVSRSGYYKWRKRDKSTRDLKREEVIALVSEVHKAHPSHGYRWVAAFIRVNYQQDISDNYVYKAFRFLGIKAKTKHQVHYRPRKIRDLYPNLIFTTWDTVDRPRQVIVSDMTVLKPWIFYLPLFLRVPSETLFGRSQYLMPNRILVIWSAANKNDKKGNKRHRSEQLFSYKYSVLSGSYFLLSVILFVCQKEAMILSRKNRETVSFYIHP